MQNVERLTSSKSSGLTARIRRELPSLVAPMIGPSRWFADKDRGTPVFTVVDIGAIQLSAGTLILTMLEATFETGEPSLYFLPLLAVGEPVTDSSGIRLDDGITLVDPVGSVLGAWLLETIAGSGSLSLDNGTIVGSSFATLSPPQIAETGERVTAEQSNSSIRFDSMIAKVYRRLSPGINPDVEVGAFLTGDHAEWPVPQLLGSLSYRTSETEYTLAMLQEKIDGPEDAWSLLLDALRTGNALAESIGRDLGELTARMHLALSNETSSAQFAAERVTSESIDGWCANTKLSAEVVIDAIASLGNTVNTSAVDLARRLVAGQRYVLASIEGYRALEGGSLIRVHGDYHLGQVLRDYEGAWWAVDFEGEPRRPIAERVRKSSPLKDVAGMLRSFSYARAAAQGSGWSTAGELADWEGRTRQSFIAAYVNSIRATRPALLPESDDALSAALTAWEVDKALYEVQYELSSRPDWLWVPLASIVERVEQTGK